MFYSAGDAELKVCILSLDSVHEARIRAVERASDGVADVVAERAYAVKSVCVGLEGDGICREGRRRCGPAFAVEHDVRVDGSEAAGDLVHGIDVVDSHEVETEAVDMVFLHPPLERFDHVFAEHLTLGCGLVAAA